jgi:hypothetical protein
MYERALALDPRSTEAQGLLATQLASRVLDGVTDSAGEVGGKASGVRPQPQCEQIGEPERRCYMQPIVTHQPHANREHRRDEAFQCFGCAR